ncbi:Uu.00g085750.m01.CDS01 [Anthostomella pinea]|uniref:Uu.00g085750.m01.CDS01 n=1 Tax=Anthostomella pinea TaxID=933095 RepID=A0AAI8VM03_9PEZI|nr:Uu.00g085750.m01.CDS01 [Anthostomella pinea]
MAAAFDITPEKQAGQLHFLSSQVVETKAPVLTPKDVDLSGQTAIVTGGNVGVGFETARQLLSVGVSKLILAVRSEASGQAAAEKLMGSRKDGPQTVEVWKLDLGEWASVTAFADRVGKTLDARPDVVVLNAGIICAQPTINPSTGHDEDIQTNYLSTVLLLVLLLPILKAKPSAATATKDPVPHISVVSSIMAHWAKFAERTAEPLLPSFDNKATANWDMEERYSASKLLALMFMTELSRRVPRNVAIINAPTPGLTHGSSFMRQTSGTMLGLFIGVFYRLFGHDCTVGSSQVLAAAVRAGPESHGHFMENGKLRP